MAEVETAAAPAPAAAQTATAEPSAFLSALRRELRPKDQAAEARIAKLDAGSLLDKEMTRLDHFKSLDTHMQGTAMH